MTRRQRAFIALSVVSFLFLFAFGVGYLFPEISTFIEMRMAQQPVEERAPVNQRSAYAYTLRGAVAAEAIEAVSNDDQLRAAVARKAPKREINRLLTAALAGEATRQRTRAEELAQSQATISKQGDPERAKDLQWMRDSHERVAADLTAAAAGLKGRADGPAADGSLAELLLYSGGRPEPRTQDLRHFAGVDAQTERLSAAEAITRVLALESQRSLATHRLDTVEVERLLPALQSELRSLLRDKAELGAVGWKLAREDTTERIVLNRGRGGGYEGHVIVHATTAVSGYRLVGGSSDMTLTVDRTAVTGAFGGRYRGDAGDVVAVVRGRFKGKLVGDTLSGTGTYLLNETGGSAGQILEEGTVDIIGLRVSNDAFVGSLTLKPQNPPGPSRTIIWSSDL